MNIYWDGLKIVYVVCVYWFVLLGIGNELELLKLGVVVFFWIWWMDDYLEWLRC